MVFSYFVWNVRKRHDYCNSQTYSTDVIDVWFFFLTLAASDLVLLCVTCCKAWIKFTFEFDISAQNDTLCKLVTFLLYVSGVLSAWTLVAMTAPKSCLCPVSASR